MLSEVLSKQSCAECGFCCSFRRQSLWELPRVPVSFTEKYKSGITGEPVEYTFGEQDGIPFAVTELHGRYLTDDPEEEVLCPFLDPHRGCTLPPEDKPFDCSIWPLRYMRMPDGELKVCLTPTCPEINQVPEARMRRLVEQGLGSRIAAYAREHPFIIKPYKPGFPIL